MAALDEIASFAHALRIEALPPELVAKAKTCILDALFGCFLVAEDARAQQALAVAALDVPGAAASVVGTRHRAAPGDAAFVNAASSAASDRSDTHAPTATHPGLMTVPPALALAEARGRDGATLIAGVIAGYETMCRLARALVTPEFAAIFRPSAMVGPTSAAVAAARVLGFAPERIAAAASLAAQSAAGLNEWAHAGTTEHPFHAAFAVRNAVTAALLAERGASAAPTILDGPSGLLAGFSRRAHAGELTRGLGRDFEMLGIVHKPAPACFFVQAPCQLVAELARRERIEPGAIERVEIRVTEAASRYPGCDNAGPIATHQGAIMSLQFSVASVLVARAIRAANWQEFGDATVNALAARAVVIADPELTAAYPRRQGVKLRVMMRGGGAVEAAQDDLLSMRHDEVVERFLAQAAPVIGRARGEQAVALLDRLETLGDLAPLASLLRAA